ncbi:hypothetical protein DBR32_09795 [Taibaiella sp. KBW10]|uniref:putative porin n=1 Tax=Taibaiella sp. KBW10 TaxID=2153357 RepID=UPI000F5AA789|nr:putative porin [Taibaiella sp. KBW10]RQO30990.1 hypothetical protein DBR32_09795 [Taibaiella sp. KBW10]
MALRFYIYTFIFIVLCSGIATGTWAQFNRPNGGANTAENNPFAQASDTAANKKKSKTDWDEAPAKIQFTYYNSEVVHYYDTSLVFFHRNQYTQPVWYKDLGNWGTTARQLVFRTNTTPGVQMGYNAWDVYKYTMDSLPFIHTTRPYTSFSFMLGSKQLQWVEIMHTQNINPRWNFAFKIANNSSSGFFNMQTTSGLNGFISTNYKSRNERLQTKIGVIFNNFKQDENGGITNDSFLTDPFYSNRINVPVRFENNGFSAKRSDVYNRQRDNLFFIQNSYAWGKQDSLYNADSTQVSYRFTPRFSIKHVLSLEQTRHQFVDGSPDSVNYLFAGNFSFRTNDTLRSIQRWLSLDNKFSLNTFIGRDTQQVKIEAGIGVRTDNFNTSYDNLVKGTTILSNYIFGQIRKEALADNQWAYQAGATFFYAGETLGNLNIEAQLSKRFPKLGMFRIGALQSITSPADNTRYFRTNYFTLTNDFNKQTTTQIYGQLYIDAIKIQLGLRNQLVSNYIYLNSNLKYNQYSPTFSILQFNARKAFNFGAFSLDNEVVWQQATNNAPVHVPSLMLRHQITYKIPAFKGRLDVYFGIEGRYNTGYYADGYTPFYNQFFYQDQVMIKNKPEFTAFFNFKVKRLRAFVMGDQMQQLFWTKNVMQAPNYPGANVHLRFGFNWIMMN